METNPLVTITVPLTLPLSLVNDFHREAQRLRKSIPDMLAMMLIESDVARELAAYEHATAERHADINMHAYDDVRDIPPLTTHLSNGSTAAVESDPSPPAAGDAP